MFHYCNVVCFTVYCIENTYYLFLNHHFFLLYCNLTCNLNSKQNILTFKLNPLCDKKTKHVKKSFDLFLLYLYNRLFLVLEALYERSCSTKRAAHSHQFLFYSLSTSCSLWFFHLVIQSFFLQET